MRRLFRLVLLCLLALALPIQGATAAAAVAGGHAMHDVVALDGTQATAMDDGAPCPHHAAKPHAGHTPERAGCGACCGPAVAQQALLAVAPVALRWAPASAGSESAHAAQFLTTGPDRPPRAG